MGFDLLKLSFLDYLESRGPEETGKVKFYTFSNPFWER
jgi:hypothetical protein